MSKQRGAIECGRTGEYGSKVLVHLNLRATKQNSQPTYSVLDAKTRRVVAHVFRIILTDATCKISKSGQARARREKQRNVHAFIAGTWVNEFDAVSNEAHEKLQSITYNPFKNDTFVYRVDGTPAQSGAIVILGFSGAYLTKEG